MYSHIYHSYCPKQLFSHSKDAPSVISCLKECFKLLKVWVGQDVAPEIRFVQFPELRGFFMYIYKVGPLSGTLRSLVANCELWDVTNNRVLPRVMRFAPWEDENIPASYPFHLDQTCHLEDVPLGQMFLPGKEQLQMDFIIVASLITSLSTHRSRKPTKYT